MKSSVSLALLSFILLGCSCVKKNTHPANDNQIHNDINALHREFKSYADEKVYFSFDSIKLSEEAKCTLILQAKWLNSKQNVVASIEGHCDEIGTKDYNLMLGLKRAKSVSDFLV
jgi:outer membrane protein OmpA-like peptidoglycan-associated protein